MSITEVLSLLEDVVLNIVKEVLNALNNAVEAYALLLQCITTHHLDSVVLQVTTTHSEAYWHTLQLVVSELKARTLVVGIVILNCDTQRTELVNHWLQLVSEFLQLLLTLEDWYNNHLNRGNLWRKNETIIIRVGHDERTNQTSTNTPRGCPYVLWLVLLVKEGNVERLSKVLT